MSYFHANNVLVVLFFLSLLSLLNNIVVGFQVSPEFEEDDHSLLDFLSSRKEVVETAGYGEEKLSTVLITGSLHCEPNHHLHHSHAWPIPGALVAVTCQSHGSERKGKSMVAKGVTDEFGDFMVDLPSYLHAIPNLEKVCRVKVVNIPKGSLCRPTRRVKKQNGLFKLSSIGNGIRTYDAGNIRIQHSTSEPRRAPPRKDIKEIKGWV
ncbi:uncharacterized protein LOC131626414 [Vicia villosa]|uniref:uncharacterized protein LOC131626414 n=1 Tax=Vicia villosa TaxID=3911 RepID=UPI00273A9CD0|nr:uncharacterized protein LOC131626414 [Vicia villosa]